MIHETITPPRTLSQAEAEVALARSDLLDAFSDLEARVTRFIAQGKLGTKGQHFGAKMLLFGNLEGIGLIAKTNYAKRDQLADKIISLLPLRADIVHSHMKLAKVDGIVTGVFVNSQCSDEAHPPCRLMTANDLRQFTRNLSKLAGELDNLKRAISLASSPPQPSPGAKGAP